MCYYLANCGPLRGRPPDRYPLHHGISARKSAAEGDSLKYPSINTPSVTCVIIGPKRSSQNTSSNRFKRSEQVFDCEQPVASKQTTSAPTKPTAPKLISTNRLPIYHRTDIAESWKAWEVVPPMRSTSTDEKASAKVDAGSEPRWNDHG